MFHLYVVGVTETGPDAVRRLCEAMAARYGLPAGDLHARLLQGPVRVKSNVDRATADRYVQDLESIGARVRLEEVLVRLVDSEPLGGLARPLDDSRFAPPAADDPPAALELAADARRPTPGFPASTPPAALPAVWSALGSPASAPRLVTNPAHPTPTPRHILAKPRVRFAAGLALAIMLGFVPAHIVASLRERSAYRAIDNQVLAAQAAIKTPAAYAALDALRADRLAAKRNARTVIIITALATWAAAGGAIAYVWFKRVPWAKLA